MRYCCVTIDVWVRRALRPDKRLKLDDGCEAASSSGRELAPNGRKTCGGAESIGDLPAHVLETILFVALKEGLATRDTLARVNRQWYTIINQSPMFWRRTCLSLADIKVCLALAQPKRRQMGLRRRLLAWLRERAGLIEHLHLMECSRMADDLPAMLQALASPTVRSLRLDACSGSTDRILRALAGFPHLLCLEVDHARRMSVVEPLGRYTPRLLCTLGTLEHLMLHVPRLEGGLECLPRALPGLKTLHVCAEEDFTFKLDDIGELAGLHEMTLTGAMLGPLPPAATRLTSLVTINLSETRCIGRAEAGELTFWDTLGLLPVLRTLSTRHCDMHGSNLSRGVLTMTSLVSLELSSYMLNLPELPAGALPRLTCLVFDGCHVLHFPPSWCHLPALRTLRFKSSPPDSLPAEISQLASLRELSLDGGLARAVLPCCALTGLTRLRLARMELLATLPSGPYLSSLLELDLAGNRFLSLPHTLVQCEHLEELDLSQNPRLQLDPSDVRDIFSHLHALRTVHLHKDSALCDMGACPWDLRSVQALMALSAARPELTVCLDASCQRATITAMAGAVWELAGG